MAIQPQTVSFPFTGGIDTGTDPKLVQMPKLLALVNGYWDKYGHIVKRNGYTALPMTVQPNVGASQSISAGHWIESQASDLFMGGLFSDGTGTPPFSGLWGALQNTWLQQNAVGQFVNISAVNTMPPAREAFGLDIAQAGSYLFSLRHYTVFDVSPGTNVRCEYSVLETATGRKIQGPDDRSDFTTSSASGTVQKLVALGTKVFIIGSTSGSANIAAQSWDSSNVYGSITAASNVITTAATSGLVWDVTNDGSTAVIAFRAGAGGITVVKMNSSGSIVGGATFTTGIGTLDGGAMSVCVVHDSGASGATRYIVAWSETGSPGNVTKAMVITASNLATFTAPFTVVAAANGGATSGPIALHGFENDSGTGTCSTFAIAIELRNSPGNGSDNCIAICSSTLAGVVSGASFFQGVGIASRMWIPDMYGSGATTSSIVHFVATHGKTYQPHHVVMHFYPIGTGGTRYTASFNNGRGSEYAQINSIPHVVRLSANKFMTHMATADRLGNGGAVIYSTKATTIDYNTCYSRSVKGRDCDLTAIPGSLLMSSGRIDPMRYLAAPYILTNSTATTGGSMSNGTYSYVVVLKIYDRKGRMIRSAPSPALTVTLTGGTSTQKVTISTLCPLLAFLSGGVYPEFTFGKIELYRTTNGGATYYYAEESPCGTPPNASELVSIVDLLADATLNQNEIIYTVGGLTPNTWWPNPSGITSIDDRVAVASNDEGKIYIGKMAQPKTGVRFAETHTIIVPDDLLSVTRMESALIALFSTGVIAYYGIWPDDTGASSIQTRILSSSIGLVDRRAFCEFPEGILFKSGAGWRLIDRSLSIQDVSIPPAAFNSLTVTSTVYQSELRQIKITHSDGTLLLYDTRWGLWTTFNNHLAVDATDWAGTYSWLNASGQVYTQSTGFQDNAAAIQLKISTAWIALAGQQGRQHIYWAELLGDYRSPHTLNIDVFYDYVEGVVVDHFTFNQNGPDGQNLRIQPTRQECMAIRFDIYDTNQSGTGESFAASGIALEIGIEGGLARLPVRQSA